MIKLLKIILKAGEATAKYPFAPLPISPNFRGKPEYDAKDCMACGACTIACPANALSMETDPDAGTRTWSIFYGRCIFCARCEEVCPTGAIELSDDFELAVFNRDDLFKSATFALAPCRCCGTPFVARKEVDYVIELLVHQGLPREAAEQRRGFYETCPDCRRLQEVDRATRQAGMVHAAPAAAPPAKAAPAEMETAP
ncbi:formate hydrogenlyase complex iron-sulfur subunit [Azospirillum halopraeferens]|uniref:formate hydrogenlyase complex iron-sulfur subunit n=1 Tax=Azospirillum halopraeferens TaxID=34010 RepID=UPI0003FBFE8E|nr:formate hydrogenlyase complex iron-sulfur subunit [Azospirillum halopraeferens]